MRAILKIAVIILVTAAARTRAMCPDGAEAACKTTDGKPGHKQCVSGHWSGCIRDKPSEPVTPPQTGTVRPKYFVLTVVYAPPGTQGGGSRSSVKYGSGSTTGSTVSSDGSFKQGYKVSVSASGGVLGTGTEIGASFGYSRTEKTTNSLDIKKSATTEINSIGPAIDGIDHNRDQIWLWLNPTLDVTLTPTSAQWKLRTDVQADIQYVYVGWLKDPSTIAPGVRDRLQHFGITPADYPEILKADPFANGAPGVDTARFQTLNTTFPYEPPYAAGDPVPTLSFSTTYTTTAATSSSVQQDYTVGASASGSAGFLGLFKASAKAEASWTWTSSDTRASSTGTSESASVTVGGPGFGYTGPTDIGVYYDVLYKSFLFVPIQSPLVALAGMVKLDSGAPVAGKEVVVVAGGVKHRTFTNAKGEYRVIGKLAGPLRVQVGAVKKTFQAPGPAKKVDFVLRAAAPQG